MFSIFESCWQTRHSQFLHLHRQLQRPSRSPFRSFLQRFVWIPRYICQIYKVYFIHFCKDNWYFLDNLLTKYILKKLAMNHTKDDNVDFWDLTKNLLLWGHPWAIYSSSILSSIYWYWFSFNKPARVRSPLGRLCMMNRKCSMDIVESLKITIFPGYIFWYWPWRL